MPLLGSNKVFVWHMLCHKCHQCPAQDGDTWCLGCAGWEALGRELCSPWPADGSRKLASDLVISCVRQIRGLRSYSQAIRTNLAASQASSRKRVAEEPDRDLDRPELKRRRAESPEARPAGAVPKRRVESTRKDDTESERFEEESEEEIAEHTPAPLAGKGDRRPPEPDGPPPHLRKDSGGRGDRRTSHRDRKHQPGGHSSAHKGTQPRHRAGRKHQRLGRLEQDPNLAVHRKLTDHFLDTLAGDKGKDSFNRLP